MTDSPLDDLDMAPSPALGLSLASRSGLDGLHLARMAAGAEAAGFTSVFVAERVADALSLAAQLLHATHHLQVGTAVANARPRHPALTAMTAMNLQDASGGRFLLGLGMANGALNGRALGLDEVPPVAWLGEFLSVLRSVSRGVATDFEGGFFRSHGLRADVVSRYPLPIYVAAMRPNMLRLAGAVADGVLLNLTPCDDVEESLKYLREGAAHRDPALRSLRLACVLPCVVSDDRGQAEVAGREVIADYALHPSAAERFRAHGQAPVIERMQQKLRSGDRPGALRLVPDELVARFVMVGSAVTCAAQVDRYRAAGIDLPILFPRPVDGDWLGPVYDVAAIDQHRLQEDRSIR